MASSRSIEVKVGILILTALGLLAAFILIMGGVNFQPTYPILVEFDNPGGLQTGAPVKIAGVKVGKIDAIEFRGGKPNPQTGKRDPLVRIRITVEKRYQESVHDNSLFYVTTQGVLGEQFLAIEPGSSDRPIVQPNDVVRGVDPPRLDLLLAEGYELLHTTVNAMRENRAEVAEAFDGLKKTLKGTGEFFDKNGDRIDRMAENLEVMTVDGSEALKEARQKYINNPQIDRIITNTDNLVATVARDTPPLLADAKDSLKSVKRLTDTVGAESEQPKIKQMLNDVADITGRAKSITRDAETIVTHIKRGKGTVGGLVMDEQLFDDLQEMARDLKHNPWKFLWRE